MTAAGMSDDPGRFGPGSPESIAAAALGRRLGLQLRPRRLARADGTVVEIEGADDEHRVVVQFVLNSGSVRSTLRNKVAADLFKLVWVSRSVLPGAHAILCVSPTVETMLSGRGWLPAAARDLGVEVVVAEGVAEPAAMPRRDSKATPDGNAAETRRP